MKRKIIIAVVAVAVVAGIAWWVSADEQEESKQLTATVQKGRFDIIVKATGELKAKNSQKIFGPAGLSRIQVYRVKITDLIPEGTVVDSGAYVATLDRSEVTNRLKDLEGELQKVESQYTTTRLDTTMQLRNARNELINLKFAMEESKIAVEQSVYEAPAVKRQAEINYDKAQRAYEQAQQNYVLKQQQAQADMTAISITLQQYQRKIESLQEVLSQFVVSAPKSGMVIYAKEWGGGKRKVGSTVSPWDLTVATLPDLSEMLSVTYINEVDISKIRTGQEVNITVDAFPEKSYSGRVETIANIGEQLPNSDAKVFEVLIELNETDSILRPAMTTGNEILTATFDDVLYIPLESLHSDSITYVFKKEGFKTIKHNVITGAFNENFIIIEEGLNKGDEIFLSVPKNADQLERTGNELYDKYMEQKNTAPDSLPADTAAPPEMNEL